MRLTCTPSLAAPPATRSACATLAVPLAIFDQDVRPKQGGPPTGARLVKYAQVPQVKYEGDAPTFVNPCCGGGGSAKPAAE